VRVSDYLDESSICFLDVNSRDDALEALVESLASTGKVANRESFYKAILDREKIVSTGIGMGVAIPHAKMDEFDSFFIAVGIQKEKGLEWNALDKAPVKLIFMIGGPENRQTEYLQILSRLTFALKNVELRKSLLTSDKKKLVLELFASF